jgi:hypothetical protein
MPPTRGPTITRGSVFLTAKQMISIAHEANHLKRAWLPQEQTVVDAVRRRCPALRNIGRHARSNGSIGWIGDISPIAIDAHGLVSTVSRYEEGYPSTVAARVLYGSARKGGRTVPVQLVVGSLDPLTFSVYSDSVSVDEARLARVVGLLVGSQLSRRQFASSWWSTLAPRRQSADSVVDEVV